MIPSVPNNFYVQMGNAQILLTWNNVPGATGYVVQRSTDGVNYTTLSTPVLNSFLDTSVLVGVQYWYQVASSNLSGTSNFAQTQANGLAATQIPTTSGQMSLYQIRLLAQQAADRVNSNFVSMPEWNSFINLAADELYDLITTGYDDYQLYQPVYFTTGSGVTQTATCAGVLYVITSLGTATNAQWAALGATGTVAVGAVFVATSSTSIPGGGTVQVSNQSQTYPMPDGLSSFRDAAGNTIVPPPIYKLAGVDLGLNNAPNGFVTVSKFNFIDRNRYVFPNTASTIYGVFGLQYRFVGYTIRLIPLPSSNQPMGIWYIPRRAQLLQDTDISEGYNGWIRYLIVRAAKYALDKEESDTSKLDAEIAFLKNRIEGSAPNRDEGQGDTVSDARSAQGYGPDGSSGGGWGGPQGYGW
jgi:hypothetical protein